MSSMIKQRSPYKQYELINSYSVPNITPSYQPIPNFEYGRRDLDTFSSFISIFKNILQNQTKCENDEDEDYTWFASGKANIEPYKGQYIAIWNKQIVSNASDAVEAERIAKDKYGGDIHPIVVYIPEDEINSL